MSKNQPLNFCYTNIFQIIFLCLAEGREIDVYVDTYRKENRYETCDTIDKVMMAWVLRKGLIVKFREESTAETYF